MNPTQKAAPGDSKGLLMIIVVVVIIIALVLIGIFAVPKLMDTKSVSDASKDIDADAYYAVFLTNGQVYFGHYKYGTLPELTDIYYLQVKQGEQQVQPAVETEEADTEGETAVEETSEAQPELSLVKLGKELHGPEDKMVLNPDHVLFYEKLKDDSNVVKAIKEDKEKAE